MVSVLKMLGEIEDTSTHFGESIAELYAGKTVEVYLGEKSGSTYYSDHDIEQKIYVTGKVLGGKGQLLLLECEVQTMLETTTIELCLNSWSITGVMEARTGPHPIHISYLFQEIRR
jgi:hypothetical protein